MSQPQRVLCPTCKGAGKIPNPQKCTYCSGSGKRLRVVEGGFEGGYRRSESYVDCSYCNGKGGPPMFAPSYIQCPTCRGRGEGLQVLGQIQCPKCQGSGNLSVPNGAYTSGMPRYKNIACPQCGGQRVVSGYVFQIE